jgi:DNA invertase Pin-like site-specific DNA recombinase
LVEAVIVQEYSDNDLSASKYSRKPRPAYLQMLQDLQEGAINAVVVYDQDRLVRQPKEPEELFEVCDRARAWHIAAVSGEIDVRNSDDLFRARILAAVNAKESDMAAPSIGSRHSPRRASASGRRPTGQLPVVAAPSREEGRGGTASVHPWWDIVGTWPTGQSRSRTDSCG